MTGSSSADTAGAAASDTVQSRGDLTADILGLQELAEVNGLDWQGELDNALEAIDSGLPVRRRRSTDPPDSPPFPRPELNKLTFTPEILDALALRVAERINASQPQVSEPTRAPKAAPVVAETAVWIRFRWPLFGRRARARA